MKALTTYTYEDGVFDFEGAVSIEMIQGQAMPWRIEQSKRTFYPILAEGVGRFGSGIRVVFETNTRIIQLEIGQLKESTTIDCVIDYVQIRTIEVNEERIRIDNLPTGHKHIALWLPQNQQLSIKYIAVDSLAYIRKVVNQATKWVHYGSSISQSNDAWSPAQTWVSYVARRKEYNVTNLGFSGECVFDPIIGRQISHMEADVITLKLGVNTYPGKSTERMFKPTVIGLIDTIRDRHPLTPIVIISPFYSAAKEVEIGPTGLSLVIMRRYLEEIVAMYKDIGDQHIYYVNGLDIFGEKYRDYLPDGLHPNAQAQTTIADNFLEKVIEPIYIQKYQ